MNEGRDVHAHFDYDAFGHAPGNRRASWRTAAPG
jgi:hypothetical protein